MLGEIGSLGPMRYDGPQSQVDFYLSGVLHFGLGASKAHPMFKFAKLVARSAGFKGFDLETPLKTAEQNLSESIRLAPDHFWSHAFLAKVLRIPVGRAKGTRRQCLPGTPSERFLALTLRAECFVAEALKKSLRAKELLSAARSDLDKAIRLGAGIRHSFLETCICFMARRQPRQGERRLDDGDSTRTRQLHRLFGAAPKSGLNKGILLL